MSAEFVRRFSSLFTDYPTTMVAAEEQRWTSRIDVDAMVESMASKAPNVKPPHVQLIKQLISSINNVTRDHPVYPVMIREAMARLNGGTGCSKDEISEFIEREYDVSPVVNVAKVVVELDKLVEGKEIVLTAENRYLIRENASASENGLVRRKGRKRGRRGGKGWRGSKARRVVQEDLVVEDDADDNPNVSNGGGGGGGCNEEENEMEKVPPGFEGIVRRNEGREKKLVVCCGEGERVGVSDEGDGGRNKLFRGRGSEEECVQGGGDVERAIEMRECGGNEGSGDLQEPSGAECVVESTALVCLPSEEVEGEDPAARVDQISNPKSLEIVSCSLPLEVRTVGKQIKLQEEHDKVLNTIADLSDTVAKLREENQQSNESGNSKYLFDEEHYMDLLRKAEAVQLALKNVLNRVNAVDVSNHTGTEVVAVPDSVSGTASESEIHKVMRSKRKPKTKDRKRTREVDKQLKSCPEQEASEGTESEQLKRPTKIKFVFSPPRPPLQQNEPCERPIVCGLEKDCQRKWPRDRSTSCINRVRFSSPKAVQIHSVVKGLKASTACFKYDAEWTIKGPRWKRPRIRGPNVKESAQPEETSVGVPAEQLPSQPEKELQDHGKALPIKLALEPGTGRIIYVRNPRKAHGQIQGKERRAKDQASNEFCDGGACLDHEEHDDIQQAEGIHESKPNLETSTGVTDNVSLDLEHQSNEPGKQPQAEDGKSDQQEEILNSHIDLTKHQNHDDQHQVEGSHERIPKLKSCAGVTDNSLLRSEHQSNEPGKPPPVEDQVSNQPEEDMLKLLSNVSNQLQQLQHVQGEGSNPHEEQNRCQSEVRNLLECQQQVEGQGSDQEEVHQGPEGQVSSQQKHHQEQLVENHGDKQQLKQKPGSSEQEELQVEAQPSRSAVELENSTASDQQEQEQEQQLVVQGQGSTDQEQEDLQLEAQQIPTEPANSAPSTTSSSHRHEQKQQQQQRVEGESASTSSRASTAATLSPFPSSQHQKQPSPLSSASNNTSLAIAIFKLEDQATGTSAGKQHW